MKHFCFYQFCLACHLFARSLNIRSIWPIDRILSDATPPFRVELGAMAVKRYSKFSKVSKLEPLHQMVLYHIQILNWASLTRGTLWSAMFLGTMISPGVSYFRWESVKAICHGFREDGIYVTRTKTSAPWATGGHRPGPYALWRC